jgi:hypothetical protein
MPHYEISVCGDKRVCRSFRDNLRIIIREHTRRCYTGPSRGKLSERALQELDKSPSLWMYFRCGDGTSGELVGLDCLPRHVTLDDVLFIEDEVLGIVYLVDDTFAQSIIDHLNAGRSLINYKLPT